MPLYKATNEQIASVIIGGVYSVGNIRLKIHKVSAFYIHGYRWYADGKGSGNWSDSANWREGWNNFLSFRLEKSSI